MIATPLLTDDVMRAALGVELVVDLGVVHQGMMGYAECETSLGIEHWRGLYLVRMVVVQRKLAGAKTSVISWPYSADGPDELAAVLADFRAVSAIARAGTAPDDRGWFERCVDFVARTHYLCEHRFDSVLHEPREMNRVVRARVVRFERCGLEVWLSTYRQPGVIISTQIPIAAFESVGHALAEYSAD
jgi:hypothetical protein